MNLCQVGSAAPLPHLKMDFAASILLAALYCGLMVTFTISRKLGVSGWIMPHSGGACNTGRIPQHRLIKSLRTRPCIHLRKPSLCIPHSDRYRRWIDDFVTASCSPSAEAAPAAHSAAGSHNTRAVSSTRARARRAQPFDGLYSAAARFFLRPVFKGGGGGRKKRDLGAELVAGSVGDESHLSRPTGSCASGARIHDAGRH